MTEYINQNQEEWEKRRKIQEEEIGKELAQWEKSRRFEKINKLREKWNKEEKMDLMKEENPETKVVKGDPQNTKNTQKIGQWGTPNPPREVENPANKIEKYKGCPRIYKSKN